jgi:hypothetical protein
MGGTMYSMHTGHSNASCKLFEICELSTGKASSSDMLLARTDVSLEN